MIQPNDLIAKFQYALDNKWGYIYATAGEKWTKEKQNNLVNYFVTKYGSDWKNDERAKKDDRYRGAVYGSKWIGSIVADCSGLFVWSFKQLGGSIYHGLNTIFTKYCSKTGKMTANTAIKPGTAVFTGTDGNHGHIGLYVGNNTVIEAQGTIAGVTTSKLSNTKWTYWGELKDVNYNGDEPTPVPSDDEATVTGKNVALRIGPDTSAKVLTRVATGMKVTLTDPPPEWVHVEFNGYSGYMMKEFLNIK